MKVSEIIRQGLDNERQQGLIPTRYDKRGLVKRRTRHLGWDLNSAAPHINAPNSVKGKPGMVRVPGRGKLYAEPPDTEDTFPPAIASYEIIDGWVVYKGRNGSEGVIVGTQLQLDTWASEVAKWTKDIPQEEARPWTPKDGDQDKVRAALAAAKKASQVLKVGTVSVKVWVEKGRVSGGDFAGNTLNLYNVDRAKNVSYFGTLQGVKLPAASAVAAHEVGHMAFAKHSSRSHVALKALTAWRKKHKVYLTIYHSLSGDFEGLMDLAALYVLKPDVLKQKDAELFKVMTDWVG